MTAGGRAAVRGRGLAPAGRPRPAYAAVVPTPLPGAGSRLGLMLEGEVLVAIDLVGDDVPLRAPLSHGVAADAAIQLAAYFADPTFVFDLPLATDGTPYQRCVWQALSRLPPGATETYGALARSAGGSARSVGHACRSNPLPIVIPCHRVVAATGLGVYMGTRLPRDLSRTETSAEGERGVAAGPDPLSVKRWLLAHEGARFAGALR